MVSINLVPILNDKHFRKIKMCSEAKKQMTPRICHTQIVVLCKMLRVDLLTGLMKIAILTINLPNLRDLKIN